MALTPDVMIALGTVAGGGLVAWGTLRNRVDTLDKKADALVATKAEKEVVDAHFDAVIQRLTRIESKLDRNTNGGG